MKERFFRVNGIIEGHRQGYQVKEENEAIPLKRFLYCDHCGKPLRGYIVQSKNIHCYKCCTIGCSNYKNASVLHETFTKMLEKFNLNISKDLIRLVKLQTVATFNQLTKGNDDEYNALQAQRKEVEKKIGRLEERFIKEEINGDLYKKFLASTLIKKRN